MKVSKTRASVIAAAATGVLAIAALAGTNVANAADSNAPSNSPTTQSTPKQHQQRPAEEALTGATADSVKAAVEAAYPDATIDRLEKDVDGKSVYETHITKADGTHVTVMLDDTFAITGEEAMPAHDATAHTADKAKAKKANAAKHAKAHAKMGKNA